MEPGLDRGACLSMMGAMSRLLACLLFFLLPALARAQLETRLYSYTNTPPAVVEARVREIVPEAHRVVVNPQVSQVLVIADTATHQRVAGMLVRLDRPVARLRFWLRHNRETLSLELLDGAIGTLPVTQTPPAALVDKARRLLPSEHRSLPAVGTVLEIHVALLRESPAAARLRVTPAVLFGLAPPYEPVRFPQLNSDLMVTGADYLDLVEQLARHEAYRDFFSSQPDPGQAPRPVGLLLSLEELHYRTEEAPHE